MAKRTKIVCTLGPATSSPDIIRQLIQAGMDVARLNLSHGSHEEHAERIRVLRDEAKLAGRPIAILLDLQGPKIRTSSLVDGKPVELIDGQELIITTDCCDGTAERVGTSYENLAQDVKPGDKILVSDGLIELRVQEVRGHEVITTVTNGGELREHQGINLPGIRISTPAITEKDMEDLIFGIEQGVDYVGLSFVRNPSDIIELKELIKQHSAETKVIAKLEKPEAIEHLEAIAHVSDGLMVARGDLGVEMSPEKVPGIQKEIIRVANSLALPVITATQMLESMIHNPQPTRAEVSDVANAIFDGTDAVMLSGETAVGKYPVNAVRMMNRIASTCDAQAASLGTHRPKDEFEALGTRPQAIGAAVSAVVNSIPVKALCVVTKTGNSARMAAHYRPNVPILAVTPDEVTSRELCLFWGVEPVLSTYARTEQEYYNKVRRLVIDLGYCKTGDYVVLTGGRPIGDGGPTNFLEIMGI